MRGKAVIDAAVSECPRETDEEMAPENSAKVEETGPGPEAEAEAHLEAEAGSESAPELEPELEPEPGPELGPAVDKMQCN